MGRKGNRPGKGTRKKTGKRKRGMFYPTTTKKNSREKGNGFWKYYEGKGEGVNVEVRKKRSYTK